MASCMDCRRRRVRVASIPYPPYPSPGGKRNLRPGVMPGENLQHIYGGRQNTPHFWHQGYGGYFRQYHAFIYHPSHPLNLPCK